MRWKFFIHSSLIFALLFLSTACQQKNKDEKVVIYTAVDQVFSEPILKSFEKKTKIKVLALYDVEATKTTGLVNRLIAEKRHPQADVFWSSEFSQTIHLKEEDVLAPYKPSALENEPLRQFDKDYYWIGFGGRARVLLINRDILKSAPEPVSIFDLLKPEYDGNKIGIANPLFGTTATHAAALYAALGRKRAKQFFITLKEKGVLVVDGNSVVRDMVVNGQLAMGLTDTDDAASAIRKGGPLKIVFLDQQKGGIGTLIIPNTVAMIKNCPHPAQAKQLIDYLLSREVKNRLLQSGWFDASLSGIKAMTVSLKQIHDQLAVSRTDLKEIFIK